MSYGTIISIEEDEDEEELIDWFTTSFCGGAWGFFNAACLLPRTPPPLEFWEDFPTLNILKIDAKV